MQSNYTGCLRVVEWGSSFVEDDIGIVRRKQSVKNEVLDIKSDMWSIAALFSTTNLQGVTGG
jgi:hypothetical protein